MKKADDVVDSSVADFVKGSPGAAGGEGMAAESGDAEIAGSIAENEDNNGQRTDETAEMVNTTSGNILRLLYSTRRDIDHDFLI